MIRTEGEFRPGSVKPAEMTLQLLDSVTLCDSARDAVTDWVEAKGWRHGEGLVFLGQPGVGKTTAGFTALRQAFLADPMTKQSYWVEQDFLSDLKTLWKFEESAPRAPSDGQLWKDYVEWEQAYWDLRESPLLFLDDVGRGYTPMHTYEVEGLVRTRNDRGLSTLAAVQLATWDNLPLSLRSVLTRSSPVVKVRR